MSTGTRYDVFEMVPRNRLVKRTTGRKTKTAGIANESSNWSELQKEETVSKTDNSMNNINNSRKRNRITNWSSRPSGRQSQSRHSNSQKRRRNRSGKRSSRTEESEGESSVLWCAEMRARARFLRGRRRMRSSMCGSKRRSRLFKSRRSDVQCCRASNESKFGVAHVH